MAYRLDPDTFVHHAPEAEGEQVSVNHEGCPAGTDTKRRLYVKRIERGKILAYCHHCGGRGISSPQGGHRRAVPSSDALLASLPRVLPEGGGSYRVAEEPLRGADRRPQVPQQKAGPTGRASFNRAEWPRGAVVWLNQYGVGDHWKWYYEPGLGRVCFTLRDTEGNSVVKVCRDVDDGKKKYLNFKDTGNNNPREYLGLKTDTLVITEDIISAQRCVDAGYSAFPLLSTTMREADLLYLTEQFSHAILWLDNDKAEVNNNRNKLGNTLKILGIKVNIVKDFKDPKYYSTTKIKEILNHD